MKVSNINEIPHGGKLVLVIPAVIEIKHDEIRVDGDFANNLRAYLEHFEEVCVICPPAGRGYRFPSTCAIHDIHGHENLRIVVLPIPYREDRYLLAKRETVKTLTSELKRADYRLISPHAGFDWSTLAAEICLDLNLPYNMEADWNVPEAMQFELHRTAWGPKKLRKYLWMSYYVPRYNRALRGSTLALLQGGDVYHDLASIATNAHSVLNVQVTANEHISQSALENKIRQIGTRSLRICYTGRASDIKGPLLWLDVLTQLRDFGCNFIATWAGDGERLEQMKRIVAARQLAGVCELVGAIPREDARDLVMQSDLFLFCHMIKESPRCLVEALALGTPIIGFGSAYSRELVAHAGGGKFVERGDVIGLAQEVLQLSHRPDMLRDLVRQAAASGALLERESAILQRIHLMKQHLAGPSHQNSPTSS